MAFIVDENTGDITLVQGDSGEIAIEGLPTDSNYSVYFSFYNEKRIIIGEVVTQTSSASFVTMFIPTSLTNLLVVNKDDDYTEYYYEIKICNENTGYEDTMCINDSDIGDLNVVRVYPKKVEGIINE